MTEHPEGRKGFREWVDQQRDPGWGLMPLTHISKGITAEDIIRAGKIRASQCDVFNKAVAYFFYGRPAYRVSGDDVIKVEGACPFCFVFSDQLIKEATSIYAFDTGAYHRRMYKHILLDEMDVEDFSLELDHTRPNKLIAKVFRSKEAYFSGDTTGAITQEDGAEAWQFHARAYLQLLTSRGRNEPDDRICSIEILFGEDVPIAGNLLAVVVPHTMWSSGKKAPWLETVSASGVEIVPYLFIPNRHPEHYHAILEGEVRGLYQRRGILP